MTIEYKDSKRIIGLQEDKIGATASQGNNGGAGQGGNTTNTGGGGGGGAGAVGVTASGNAGGNGGIGLQSDIWQGTNDYYAGGGGGGTWANISGDPNGGTGGTGGGGNGGEHYDNPSTQTGGDVNTGGGGGAAGITDGTVKAGGSGVVILQFTTSGTTFSTTGSPTSDTTVSGKTTLKYTDSGTFVLSSGSPDVRYLVVGGGGGGAGGAGGGGGAGGFLTGTKSSLASGTYTVTIGDGGAGFSSSTGTELASNGENSSFAGVVASGGGGGANNNSSAPAGGNGGSGGGGGGRHGGAGGSTVDGTTVSVTIPTDVQDNSLFVEKDTARRYWFDDSFDKTGCLIYYNFEQTSGDLTNQATTTNGFTDGLGSTGDGTSSGTVGKSNTGKVGNNAWSFGGGSVSSGSSSSLVLTGNASWVGWVKVSGVTSSAPADVIFSIRGGATNNQVDNALFSAFVVENTSPADLRYFHEYSSGSNQQYDYSSSDLTHGTWYHIAFVRDNSAKTVKLYVDGSLNGTYTYTNSPDTSATSRDLDLGGNGFDGTLDGMLDEVSLWNRVLTDAEITTLYNSGTGNTVDTAKGATWTMQPTYDTDFTSTSGWLTDGTDINIDTSVNAIISDNNNGSTTHQGISKDLGSDLHATKWVIDLDIYCTNITNSNSNWTHIGMSNYNASRDDDEAQNFMGINVLAEYTQLTTGNGNYLGLMSNSNTTLGNFTPVGVSGDGNEVATGTQFYLRLIRDGETTLKLERHSTSARTGSTLTTTHSCNNLSGLRYFVISHRSRTHSGRQNLKIENVRFYNGVTSIN